MRTTIKMKRVLPMLALLAGVSLTAGCDFLDPTSVDNPRTTSEDLAQAQAPTTALMPGLRAQFARLVASAVVLTEVISDNYSIHGTGLNAAYDFPRDIRPQLVNSTGSATGLYWNAQELRALAEFVIEDIIPGDTTATAAQLAEARFYRGMGFLYLGENMVGAVVEEDEAPVGPDSLLALATADLTAAAADTGRIGLAATAALARAHRLDGNAADASSRAQAVLAADPDFLLEVGYDRSSIENTPYFFLVSRSLREMQPLPRLDFLDPKYIDFTSAIPVLKAEEMHLIAAEAEMAQGSWAAGREHLAEAVETALARPTTEFFDDDPRVDATFVIRPRDREIAVAPSPGATAVPGLVLERPGTIDVPTISGTSLDPADIRAMGGASAAEQTELLRMLYLARQEILILEGRRMSDLGIRLPIMLREIETNPSIELGDFATTVLVPSYIPAAGELDSYSPVSPYPEGTKAADTDVEPSVLTVEVLHDMNAVLAQNRQSLPLFGS